MSLLTEEGARFVSQREIISVWGAQHTRNLIEYVPTIQDFAFDASFWFW